MIFDPIIYYIVDSETECWEWQRCKYEAGYGRTVYKGVSTTAHRAMWLEMFGEIPDGICVCHRCDNPSCINPNHLFLGTQKENIRDMLEKGRHRNGSDILRGKPYKQTLDKLPEIRRLRDRGETWGTIGHSVGITGSAASQLHKRYAKISNLNS